MTNKMAEIRTKKGETNTNIILIAPHGHKEDDENTGKLTRAIRNKLDCHAIINEVYRRPKKLENGTFEKPDIENKILNLNYKPQAEQHKRFLDKIKAFITDADNTHVFWIHGIKDENLDAEATEMGIPGIKGLIGYGQPDRHSITVEKAQALLDNLKAAKLNMVFTKDDADNYRGWSQDNMNQWFRQEQNGYAGVQSIQLEFALSGVRDEDSIDVSSQAIANAISELVDAKPVAEQEAVADSELVESACTHVRGLINDNNAMLKVGQYLIETFYAGNYDWAKNKKRFKNQSLIEVIDKLNTEGYAPAKTWFYNAVKLAVDEHDFKDFRTYGKLGHSHKVYLTHVKDFKKKKDLIDETVSKKLTVKQLRDKIAEKNGQAQKSSNGYKLPNIEDVKKLAAEKREKKISVVNNRKLALDDMIKRLSADLNNRKKEQKACEEWLEGIEKYLGQVAVEQMEKNINRIQEGTAKMENEPSNQSQMDEAAMANEGAQAQPQTMSSGA
jgi:hypothetical protein